MWKKSLESGVGVGVGRGVERVGRVTVNTTFFLFCFSPYYKNSCFSENLYVQGIE